MLPYIATGFGFGLLLYPWFGPAQGTLSFSQEMARQAVLFLVTLFVAAAVKVPPKLTRIPVWAPALIVLTVCLVLRHTVLAGLPFVPGDEDEYLFQARILARGHLTAPAPPQVEHLGAPGILVHGGRWFGHHQPGHGLALALGLVVGLPTLLPALSTALTVLLLSLTARKVGGAHAGILTGLVAMTSPMVLLTGATMVSETTSLLLVAAVCWLVVTERLGPRSLLGAGIVLGALLNVRAVTGLAALAAAMVVLGRRARLVAPGVLLGLLALLAHNALTTGSPFTLPFQLYEPHALGFRGGFGPLKALAHLVRNGILLNFWLLGWPVSFILLRRGAGVDRRLTHAAAAFILVIVVANAFYWHPGQVATGPLRLHETAFFLLLLSGLGWEQAVRSNGFLARYVPLAMAAAHMGFMPVREAVLHTFVRTVHEPRTAVARLALDQHVVVLSGEGDLFHYPTNDPWLRKGPLMAREGADLSQPPCAGRPHLRLDKACTGGACTWRVVGGDPGPPAGM